MNVLVVTPPSFEPVTLAEAKLWCRLDDDDTSQDAVLLLLIIAMREYVEHLTGRALAERTIEVRLDSFPRDGKSISLPHAPLQSVTSVQYIAVDGTLTSLDASPTGWQEDTVSVPGRIAPLTTSGGWPDTSDGELGAVRIRYVAGYQNPNSIPRLARLWMQARLATLFENREQIIAGGFTKIPRDFTDGLLDSLRTYTQFA